MKHLEILNHEGKTLRGYLHLPVNFNGKLVLMYHGFTGNKTEHGGLFRDLSRLLEQENVASLRMDFSGNGESDGSFRDFTFDTMISEANILVDYVKALGGVKNIILLGFSMGGALAAYIASRRSEDISKLVLWSPAGNINQMIKDRYEHAPKLQNGDADFGNYPLSRAMYESVDKHILFSNLDAYKGEVLIIHGKKDLSVNYLISYEYAKQYENVAHYIIESAGHGYDKKEEKEELLKKTCEFVR